MLAPLKRWRRRRITRRPFPPQWRAIVQRGIPLAAALPSAERSELEDLIKVFLAEKNFEGCAGLQLTDEIRITIATQACLLVLKRPDLDLYPRLGAILVYPKAYVATHAAPLFGPPGMIVHEGPQHRAGESWHSTTGWGAFAGGPVVLSWDDARRGAFDPADGRNLVFHEFAHQLDSMDGSMNGAPLLPERSMYPQWASVMSREFNQLRHDAVRSIPTLIDTYGATNPAEFFAVVTECYFERPGELSARHPELYGLLRQCYGWSPAEL